MEDENKEEHEKETAEIAEWKEIIRKKQTQKSDPFANPDPGLLVSPAIVRKPNSIFRFGVKGSTKSGSKTSSALWTDYHRLFQTNFGTGSGFGSSAGSGSGSSAGSSAGSGLGSGTGVRSFNSILSTYPTDMARYFGDRKYKQWMSDSIQVWSGRIIRVECDNPHSTAISTPTLPFGLGSGYTSVDTGYDPSNPRSTLSYTKSQTGLETFFARFYVGERLSNDRALAASTQQERYDLWLTDTQERVIKSTLGLVPVLHANLFLKRIGTLGPSAEVMERYQYLFFAAYVLEAPTVILLDQWCASLLGSFD